MYNLKICEVVQLAEGEFKIFEARPDKPVMPNAKQKLDEGLISEEDIRAGLKSGSELISEGLDRAILGDTVKSMMIPEDLNIAIPNYVIDFTSLDELYEFQMEAIDALLHPDGDVTIYAYTRAGLAKLGRGLSSILDRILTLAISNLFEGKCTIYKDFIPGEPLKTVSEKDITTMRLSI